MPNYYVKNKFYIYWSQTALSEIYALGGMRNPHFQFKKGVAFSWTGFYAPTFRVNTHCVFDQSSSCIFQDVYEIEEILGILASKLVKYIAKTFCDHTVNSTASVIERIVIPMLDTERKVQIGSLVSSIIEHQKQEPQYDYTKNEQKQIDMLVNQSYGLDDVNIREVELWHCRRYSKLAEAQGILAEVKEKYVDHLARCQRILEKPPSYWRSNPVLQLIAQGEGHELEFKETLEYNIHTNQRTPELAKSSLKTIAAFLNADGGVLLLGVSDSGEVKGLDRDLQFVRRKNLDGFEQKLCSLINDRFDPPPLGNVEITFEELQEGTVCRIRVEQSSEPVAFDNEFYIRDGNGTRKLEGRDLADWLRRRNNR